MSASGQAQALKQQYRKDYELWKKSDQLKKEMTHLRTELNPIKHVRKVVPRNRSTNPAQKKIIAIRGAQRLAESLKNCDEETFYNSPTLTKGDQGSSNEDNVAANQLALPNIFDTEPRRIVSAVNAPRDRGESVPNFNQKEIVDDDNSQKALSSSQNKQKEFKVHVIKHYTYDPTLKKRKQKEKEEKEQEETRQRKLAQKVLEKHGVTQSQCLQIARRASFQRKASNNSIQEVTCMVFKYEQEIQGYQDRIRQLEQKEVQRIAKVAADKEELYNNHGKAASYFKAPQLNTRVRSNSRRFNKVIDLQLNDKQLLAKKQNEQAKAQNRQSKFALDKTHNDLVKLITQRQIELDSLKNDSLIKQQSWQQKNKVDSKDSFNTEISDDKSLLVKQTLIKSEEGDELQLDLTMIKASKRGQLKSCKPKISTVQGEPSSLTTQIQASSVVSCDSSDSDTNSSSDDDREIIPQIDIVSDFNADIAEKIKISKDFCTKTQQNKSFYGNSLSSKVAAKFATQIQGHRRTVSKKDRSSLVSLKENYSPKPAEKFASGLQQEQIEIPRSEARKTRAARAAFSPLSVSANFQKRRQSRDNSFRSTILKPEQIIRRKQELTSVLPTNLETEKRSPDTRKVSIYKINAQKYQSEIHSQLRTNSASGRADKQLAQFKKNEELHPVQQYEVSKQRYADHGNKRLEPMSLIVDRDGRRVSKDSSSPKKSNSSRNMSSN